MSKSSSRKLNSNIQIRTDASTKEALQEKAKNAGLSLSQYLIRAGLGRRMVNKSDTQMLAMLNKLGAMQKHLFVEGKRTGDKEYSEVLSAIRAAALRLARDDGNDEEPLA
ncbi:plasmid mobilization protein MobA [Xenorhabdus sp. PR6a]|uniref:plasmid mobilization protein MobA n=1 Tax=Xenorhabdus sp. PR6a TaxID=3025877 RepID=UPI002359D9EE|nr:plasmid mobilization protein MobA [Xenorhabdus sp. PR6a]MDC9582055.1 plasmid mobilization protein MobA [Xenorhabdus sp. PR6a]